MKILESPKIGIDDTFSFYADSNHTLSNKKLLTPNPKFNDFIMKKQINYNENTERDYFNNRIDYDVDFKQI